MRDEHQPRLATLALPDPIVLVLADAPTIAGVANAKGHLFERFVAHLLASFGFENPSRERLNVTVDGIELDVTAKHRLTNQTSIAECKAYTAAIRSGLLAAFYGKLMLRRYDDPELFGFFVALPRLTSDARTEAEKIVAHDSKFKVLSAAEIVNALRELSEISEIPIRLPLTSDPAVVITEHGVYAACLEIDPITRTPNRALVWAPDRAVPTAVIEALAGDEYSQSVPVEDARSTVDVGLHLSVSHDQEMGVIVPVIGSGSDFEYQLPASPRFFVGRQKLIGAFEQALQTTRAVLVLNAQSGWGKSSLALRFKQIIDSNNGYALVVDSRTASSPRFVTEVLRRAALDAEKTGLLSLSTGASWASLASALRTFGDAEWLGKIPMMVFFDQFENVFRNEIITREFRDLALGVQEHSGKLLVGFAWKTDLVGWTEDHPYRLRDEIRGAADVVTLTPFGAAEVDVLLRRLERELGQSLARDLRQRLREYSQGLPWLLKKLAGHLLREVRQGATQEQLISEALNVQNLFDADLAEIGPGEQEGLRYVARYAPVAVGEALERIPAHVIQSLLDRRLLVQVGERLDTYWDIFRDYLNTGRIPVEDSYIVRQTPKSEARLLRLVIEHGGDMSIPEIAEKLNTSENAVFNLSRELRLLGVAGLEPNRARLVPEVWQAPDRETALRQRVAASLRRHRAYSAFTGLAERSGGRVSATAFARELPNISPAVEVSDKTWLAYARAFLLWFEYAGLAERKGAAWSLAGDQGTVDVRLLGVRLPQRVRAAFPHDPAGPSLRLLERLGALDGFRIAGPIDKATREAARSLIHLGAVAQTADGGLELVQPDVLSGGRVSGSRLRGLIAGLPSGRAALATLDENPAASPMEVGEVLRAELGAEWEPNTTRGAGKHFRSWARAAGVITQPPRRGTASEGQGI